MCLGVRRPYVGVQIGLNERGPGLRIGVGCGECLAGWARRGSVAGQAKGKGMVSRPYREKLVKLGRCGRGGE